MNRRAVEISNCVDEKINDKIEEDIDDKLFNHGYGTMIHKYLVIKVCLKMSKYLYDNGDSNMAFLLLKRANNHDNSKLVGPELQLLSNLGCKKEIFKNPNIQLSKYESEIIENHWKNNRHHPEHFNEVQEMSELDIIEMVCDWYARSLQYTTNFLDFVKTRQENRFHFPNEMFKKIWKYCEIVNSFDWGVL